MSSLTDQLRNGLLLSLPPRLIRRLKSHFYTLPPPCGPSGVDVILGLNGYVWVAAGVKQEHQEGGEGFDAEGVYSDKNDVSRIVTQLKLTNQDIPPESRHAISLVANIITVLAREGVPITDTVLLEGYAWATEKGLGTGELLKKEVGEDLVREVVGF
jgi:exosome complex component RRP4